MTLREVVPAKGLVLGRRLVGPTGSLTAAARLRPQLVVAGAQRCGTTSLFRALEEHPCVFPPVMHKGVNYFDVNYTRGEKWYMGHFPLTRLAAARTRGHGAPMSFEASGYYMYHPLAPERLARDLPEVKVLVMLRDPVERAYSAHKHEMARGFETKPFDLALELEEDRLRGEVDRILEDPSYRSFSHRHHAYLRRGHYAEQVSRLLDLFGPGRVLVTESERFFESPEDEYAKILEFLELPQVFPANFERHNGRPRSPMPEGIRERLRGYFQEHDKDLADLLGQAPAWTSH